MARWIETFSKPYIGFNFEATAFNAAPMLDMDAAGLRQNFAIADRTKQYFSISDPVSVFVGGVLQAQSAYVLQRLGGIVRFVVPLGAATEGANPTVAPASPSTSASGGTFPNGVYLIGYTYTSATGETLLSPTGTVTATGTGLSTITCGAAAALVAPNTGTNWYISNPNGDVTTMRFVGSVSGVTGPVVTAPPVITAVSPPSFDSVTTVTITGKSIPVYRLGGAKNVGNTSARAEIDTTGGGDIDMTGAPGRAKRGGSFTFTPGDTVTNAAGRVVTLKNMIEQAAVAGTETVMATVNDVRNPLLPRDVSYGFIGNTDMQRNLNTAIDEPITWYQAACSDAPSYNFIDYVP